MCEKAKLQKQIKLLLRMGRLMKSLISAYQNIDNITLMWWTTGDLLHVDDTKQGKRLKDN